MYRIKVKKPKMVKSYTNDKGKKVVIAKMVKHHLVNAFEKYLTMSLASAVDRAKSKSIKDAIKFELLKRLD